MEADLLQLVKAQQQQFLVGPVNWDDERIRGVSAQINELWATFLNELAYSPAWPDGSWEDIVESRSVTERAESTLNMTPYELARFLNERICERIFSDEEALEKASTMTFFGKWVGMPALRFTTWSLCGLSALAMGCGLYGVFFDMSYLETAYQLCKAAIVDFGAILGAGGLMAIDKKHSHPHHKDLFPNLKEGQRCYICDMHTQQVLCASSGDPSLLLLRLSIFQIIRSKELSLSRAGPDDSPV